MTWLHIGIGTLGNMILDFFLQNYEEVVDYYMRIATQHEDIDQATEKRDRMLIDPIILTDRGTGGAREVASNKYLFMRTMIQRQIESIREKGIESAVIYLYGGGGPTGIFRASSKYRGGGGQADNYVAEYDNLLLDDLYEVGIRNFWIVAVCPSYDHRDYIPRTPITNFRHFVDDMTSYFVEGISDERFQNGEQTFLVTYIDEKYIDMSPKSYPLLLDILGGLLLGMRSGMPLKEEDFKRQFMNPVDMSGKKVFSFGSVIAYGYRSGDRVTKLLRNQGSQNVRTLIASTLDSVANDSKLSFENISFSYYNYILLPFLGMSERLMKDGGLQPSDLASLGKGISKSISEIFRERAFDQEVSDRSMQEIYRILGFEIERDRVREERPKELNPAIILAKGDFLYVGGFLKGLKVIPPLG